MPIHSSLLNHVFVMTHKQISALVRRDATSKPDRVEVGVPPCSTGATPAIEWEGRVLECVLAVQKAPGGDPTQWIASYAEEVTASDSPEHAADLKFPLCMPLYSQRPIVLVGLSVAPQPEDAAADAPPPFAFGALPQGLAAGGVSGADFTLDELTAFQAAWASQDITTTLSLALDGAWKTRLASAVALDDDGMETFVAEDETEGPDVEIALAFSHLHQQPSYGNAGAAAGGVSSVSGGGPDDDALDDGTDLLDIDTHTGLALESGKDDVGDEDEMESIEGSEEENDVDDDEEPVAEDDDVGEDA